MLTDVVMSSVDGSPMSTLSTVFAFVSTTGAPKSSYPVIVFSYRVIVIPLSFAMCIALLFAEF